MEYTMVQDTARDYSHCPPKKRPLAFYNVQADEHGELVVPRGCSGIIPDPGAACSVIRVLDCANVDDT